MTFEVFTYGGGEFLRLVFNGIAAIMGNDSYAGLLGVVALIGLLWFLIAAALSGGRRGLDLQWFFSLLLVYFAFMLPKSEVLITDRIDPSQSAVVSQVPLGLAGFAGLTSRIGDWLTRSFETVFSLPNDLQYSETGLLFGSHLVEASTHFEVTDSRTAGNLSEFWRQCVFYDILLGRYTWDELFAARDTWAYLRAHTARARSFAYTQADGGKTTLQCRAGAAGALGADLNRAIDQAKGYYGGKLIRAPSRNAAVTKFAAAMPVSFQYIAGLSSSAEQIIRQNALANSLRRGVSEFGAAVGADAAVQDFALARAEQERRTSYAVLGEVTARTLPLMRNLFEALIYAIAPIAFVLAMLPAAAKVVMAYLKSLLWLQLWAPLYAVIHFAMTFYSRYPAETALVLPDGHTALSLATHTALGQVMNDLALIAGYLSLSIPMISYLVVNQGGAMMASLASRVAQSYEGPVSKAADEASSGNISLGNTSLGNAAWWQTNTAPMTRSGTATWMGTHGETVTATAGGGTYVDMQAHSMPASLNATQSLAGSAERAYGEALQSARNQSTQVQQLAAGNIAENWSFLHQHDRQEGMATQHGREHATQYQPGGREDTAACRALG